MSLINKMLQDLDARGAVVGQATPQLSRRPGYVAPARRLWWIIGGVVLAVLLALALVGWRVLRPAAPAMAPPSGVVIRSGPAGQASPAGSINPVTMAPVVAAPVPAHADADGAAGAISADPASHRPVRAKAVNQPERKPVTPDAPVTVRVQSADVTAALAPRNAAAAAKAAVPPADATRESLRQDGDRPVSTALAKENIRSGGTASRRITIGNVGDAGNGGVVRDADPRQLAENDYRLGLVFLQKGQVVEALASMEQAVQVFPRHEPARQTLIGLLQEQGRNDEAAHHLAMGLGLNKRQPTLAMMLARMQIDRDVPRAVATLETTLPYALSNPDYHAFLAAALQRAGRNADAVAQYTEALRLKPQSGIWWMGLGISQQADKHTQQARDAFRQAVGTGTLTPELSAYVERQLQQLNR